MTLSINPGQTRWGALRKWIFFATLVLIAPLSFSQAADEKTRKQLQALERDIARISSDISSATMRRDKLQKQLREVEIELGELQKGIADNTSAIGEQERTLTTLRTRSEELVAARDEQQSRIALELRSAWRLGDQGQLKIMLNQEDPQTVARGMAYYRYIFRARETLIQDYRETLNELQEVTAETDATLAALEQTREQLQRQQSNLSAALSSRTKAVANLNSSIAGKGNELKKLQEDREELERLLEAIEETVINLEVPDNYQAFTSAKGKMPWPVSGKHSNRFGKSRNAGKMRWQGVTIGAEEGTTVNAIHHGRVVYSDWLRGSGLLIIVDHGDGYMSLYAHNQSLLKDVGEWVGAGTAIATVGNSGGRETAGLYFEVRHNGKPTDPAKWCTD